MNYHVIYTLEHKKQAITRITEWVCPFDYTIEQALQSFKQQFPTATVISIRPFTELSAPDTTADR